VQLSSRVSHRKIEANFYYFD